MLETSIERNIRQRSKVALQNIETLYSAAGRASADCAYCAYASASRPDVRAAASAQSSLISVTSVAELVLKQCPALVVEVRAAHSEAGSKTSAAHERKVEQVVNTFAADLQRLLGKLSKTTTQQDWSGCADHCDEITQRLRRYSKDLTRSFTP